jgi:hypothetical protein
MNKRPELVFFIDKSFLGGYPQNNIEDGPEN